MSKIAIVSAKRTAVGGFLGSLKNMPAHELGAAVIKDALAEINLSPEMVDDVIMGQVLTANCGQNPARQAAMAAGIPKEKTAMTINQVCGSGLRSVMLGAQQILAGDSKIVVAGGQENMSLSPHAQMMRDGTKMGDSTFADTMIKDGLWDAFHDIHMGITAENLAEKFDVSRDEMDHFAYGSQLKAAEALENGSFENEVTKIEIPQRKGDAIIFDKDEHPRLSPVDKLAGLRPAFSKDGKVTAGNSSGINDGAAVVVLMREEEAVKRGLKPLAVIESYATKGVDPKLMGIAPVVASQEALKKVSWTADELDLVEANEAFAAQAIAVNKEMGWDVEKVNVNGGAIALGHPIGASGARCLVTLLHAMQKRKANKGLVTLCIGGGQGVSLCVSRGC